MATPMENVPTSQICMLNRPEAIKIYSFVRGTLWLGCQNLEPVIQVPNEQHLL